MINNIDSTCIPKSHEKRYAKTRKPKDHTLTPNRLREHSIFKTHETPLRLRHNNANLCQPLSDCGRGYTCGASAIRMRNSSRTPCIRFNDLESRRHTRANSTGPVIPSVECIASVILKQQRSTPQSCRLAKRLAFGFCCNFGITLVLHPKPIRKGFCLLRIESSKAFPSSLNE